MAVLTLTLLDSARIDRIDDVTSLVAADASGHFGLQPGHANFVTMLEPGLFRFRCGSPQAWNFGACVGGLLSCVHAAGRSDVRIVSSRILRAAEPEILQIRLEELLRSEGSLRLSAREGRLRLDLDLYRRLQQLAQMGP